MNGLRTVSALGLAWVLLSLTACQNPADDSHPAEKALSLANPSWDIQYSDSTIAFVGLFAVDETTVWASGTGGGFVRTIDGGKTWKRGTVLGADSLAFRDIHAFDDQTAYVLSIGNATDSRIYRTDNGGDSWILSFENEDPKSFFDCFSFWDKDRGIAFSDSHEGHFRLIRTMNGGETWEDIPASALPDARAGEGAFASSGTCVVTRDDGLGWFSTGASGVDTRVIRTADYGKTWQEAPTPIESGTTTAGIFTLSFLDDNRGIAMGGDYGATDSLLTNAAITSNGGASWTPAGMSNLKGSIYGAAYLPGASSAAIVAVAPSGSDFSADNAQTWTLFSSHNFWTITSVSPSATWAAGPGQIGRLQFEETTE